MNIKQTHFGSGDNVAGNKIVNINKPARELTDDFKEGLLTNLHRDKKIVVMLMVGGDGEALNFYNEIRNFLIQQEFNVEDGFSQGISSKPIFDVEINIHDPKQDVIMVGSTKQN